MRNAVPFLFLLLTFPLFGCSHNSSGGSPSATAASVVTLSASSPNVTLGQSVTFTVAGGTGSYVSAVASEGTIVQASANTFTYTAPATSTNSTVVITITDSAGNAATAYLTISGSVLSISASTSTIALNGQVILSVSGGTPTYTWQITSGGGTLSATTGASVTFTAPGTAGYTNVSVSDSAGNTTQMSLYIGGTSSGMSCTGTYSATIGGASATLSLIEDTNGNVAGYVLMNNYYLPISGTCSMSGTSGTLTFNDLIFNNSYSASLSVSSSQITLSGTMSSGGNTYTFTGTLQGTPASLITPSASSCQGAYNATIGSNSGTMSWIDDGNGNVEGVLTLQGYYYVVAGTCSIGGGATFTNLTSGSKYTGTVTQSGVTINMSGNFSTTDGHTYSWSAVSQ